MSWEKNKLNILVDAEWLQHTLDRFGKEIGGAALKGLSIAAGLRVGDMLPSCPKTLINACGGGGGDKLIEIYT